MRDSEHDSYGLSFARRLVLFLFIMTGTCVGAWYLYHESTSDVIKLHVAGLEQPKQPDLNDPWTYIERGQAFDEDEHALAIDEYNKAIKDLTRAIEIDPEDFVAYFNRASIYSQNDQHEKSKADYEMSLRLVE